MVVVSAKWNSLVAYDYGMGGIWAYLWAESDEQIRNKFSEVEVFAEPPAWWAKEKLAHIESEGVLDIENVSPESFAKALLEDRGLG